MKELEDEKLIKRMLNLFENHEDDSADMGWKELRKKYPEKNKRRPLVIWLSSAAALLLIVAGVWLLKPAADEIKNSLLKAKRISPTTESAAALKNSSGNSTTIAKSKAYSKKPTDPDSPTPGQLKNPPYNLRSEIKHRSVTRQATNLSVPASAYFKTLAPSIGKLVDNENKNLEFTAAAPFKTSAFLITDPVMPDSSINAIAYLPETTLISAAADREHKTADVLLKSKSDMNPKNKLLTFDFFAGPYLSFANGSTNSFNTAAGLSSYIRLSGRLKLSTGISIAQNNFSFNGGIPVKSSGPPAYYSSPAQNLGTNSNPSITTTSVDAKLLGLDVPVNLKYNFSNTKNDLFVSAGFSSNTFINESYTYYNTVTIPGAATRNETIENRFKSFNLARTLNFSFGLGYPIGKNERLFIEPFLKYPLGGLGAQNIRFGSTGINLKLNFAKGSR